MAQIVKLERGVFSWSTFAVVASPRGTMTALRELLAEVEEPCAKSAPSNAYKSSLRPDTQFAASRRFASCCGRDRKLVFVPRHGPISRDELRAILAAASLDEADFDRLRCERDSRPSGFESLAPNDGLSHTAGLRVRFDHVLNALGLRRSDARASCT